MGGGKKPVRHRLVKVAGKNPLWLVPFGLAIYHFVNDFQFTEKAKDDNFKMAAEVIMLTEVVDLLVRHDDDREFHLAFTKRDLKRIASFYEVAVPSYSVDDFQVTSPFNELAQELPAQGKIPTGNHFGRKPILEILDYFSRRPIFFAYFPVGRAKFAIVSPFTF